MKTLEDILVISGSKKPFLKNPKKCTDGSYNCLTKSGSKSYEKLVKILYILDEIGVTNDSSDTIKKLDEIISSQN